MAEASLDDLQDDLVERFRTPRSATESSRFLSNLHLARTDETGQPQADRCGHSRCCDGPSGVAAQCLRSGGCLPRHRSPRGIGRSLPARRRRRGRTAGCAGRERLPLRRQEYEDRGLQEHGTGWTDRSSTWPPSSKRWSMPSRTGTTPSTGPRSACGSSMTGWRSTRPGRFPIRWASTIWCTFSRPATRLLPVCWRESRCRTTPWLTTDRATLMGPPWGRGADHPRQQRAPLGKDTDLPDDRRRRASAHHLRGCSGGD